MKLGKLSFLIIATLLAGCNSDSNTTGDSTTGGTPPVDPKPPGEVTEGESHDVIADILPAAILSVPDVICSEVFTSTSALESAVSKEMQAGTTFCLADGTYNDLEITFGGVGTEDNVIKVAAQNSGKVEIIGSAKIIMGGSYVQLQGFVFNGASSSSSNLISTRFGTGDLCHHCRITEIAVIDVDADQGISSDDSTSGEWIHIYGKNNWLDHSILSGKTTASPMISFNRWVDSSWDEATKVAELAQGIIVYNNYIANRAPAKGQMYAQSSDNNYEAIRTGLSDTHHYDGDSFIVGNLFENIQGEAEVVSNKGTNNTISFNTIRNSYGSVTTRHGGGATISNNFFFGEDYPLAGGIRLVDGDHTVTNNYIEGARYKDTTHHGGIVMMGSDGAGDGDNGYQEFSNVHIAHNTIVDSVNSLNIDGGGKSSAPKQAFLANNLIDLAIGPVLTQSERGFDSSSQITGNIIYGQAFADSDSLRVGEPGFEFISAALEKDQSGVYRLSNDSPNLDAVNDYEKGEFEAVYIDLDGQVRSETTLVGADESFASEAIYAPLNYENVGPVNYTLPKPVAIMIESPLNNASFDEGLEGWSYQNAQLIEGSDAFSRNSSIMVGANSELSQAVTLAPNTRYNVSAFVKGAYRIAVGDGVTLEGQAKADEYTWVNKEFVSGSGGVAELVLGLPKSVQLFANVADPQLGLWRQDSGSSDVWTTYEGSSSGNGDVGSSGDSAFNDSEGENGSARIRYKSSELSHDFESKPGLSQVVSGLPLHTDMTASVYYCDSKGDDSISTLHFGLRQPNEGTIAADRRAHVSELDDADVGSVKSCFRRVTLDFNTGDNDTLELFALMEVNTDEYTNDQLMAHNQYTDNGFEVRVDEFAISYSGEPSDELVGYLDEIRLVKRVER
ncbi:polysaccharide lyase 6 family protein [Vibrio sp. 10N.261.51.F12]|uniref:polysaccharide lyase 6 family protein n=1 Tax=Vibrio sp. 10N.261.51.F12 TaxID=3229679 RepID=UPI00354DD4E2